MSKVGDTDLMQTDEELVNEVKSGSRGAFGELVKRHQRAIYRLAMRFTADHGSAEDIMQETFIKAYQNISSFEFRSSFKSWLYRIAINNSKNRLRSSSGHGISVDDITVIHDTQVEKDLQLRELGVVIYNEVLKLPVRQRTALILRIYDDLSFQEIALIMECPYDTAKANFRHGILKIKESMGSEFFNDLSSVLDSAQDTHIKFNILENQGD